MALSPLKSPSERAVQVPTAIRPSKTYTLDFDTGEIGGIVDGKDAIIQFIQKAVVTARFRFLVYNGQYGCELDDLVGQDVPLPLLQAEIPRVIREALIYDDRIKDVRDFAIRRESDAIYIEFTADTVEGAITQGVTI